MGKSTNFSGQPLERCRYEKALYHGSVHFKRFYNYIEN